MVITLLGYIAGALILAAGWLFTMSVIRIIVRSEITRLFTTHIPDYPGQVTYVLAEKSDGAITWIAVPGNHGVSEVKARMAAQRINRALSQASETYPRYS